MITESLKAFKLGNYIYKIRIILSLMLVFMLIFFISKLSVILAFISSAICLILISEIRPLSITEEMKFERSKWIKACIKYFMSKGLKEEEAEIKSKCLFMELKEIKEHEVD